MSSLHSAEQAEPNLTPILDMVFQLITFFMLVINFQTAALDMSLKLPVVGSARPTDKGSEDLLVLNVNTKGELMVYGGVKDPAKFLALEAIVTRRHLEVQGKKIKPGDELPTLVVIRADSATPFDLLNKVLTECQTHGFRKFALRAMNREEVNHESATQKKERSHEEVTLNLAAMLDMAFQLLAFFILTFKPAPVEGQINLNLPPPVPMAQQQQEQQEKPDGDPGIAAAHTLNITIVAAGNGKVASISVGLAKLFEGPLGVRELQLLNGRLKDVFAIAGKPFDQVLLRVGKALNYGELMKIIDVCTRQKMADGKPVTKISFIELPEK